MQVVVRQEARPLVPELASKQEVACSCQGTAARVQNVSLTNTLVACMND